MREKVWRYRGVLLVLAAPAFLLLAILALAPASRAPARYSSTLHDAAAAVPHHRTPDLHRKEAAGAERLGCLRTCCVLPPWTLSS